MTLSSSRFLNITGPEVIILGKRWDTVAFVDDQGFDQLVVMYHRHINSIDAYDSVQSESASEG